MSTLHLAAQLAAHPAAHQCTNGCTVWLRNLVWLLLSVTMRMEALFGFSFSSFCGYAFIMYFSRLNFT
jgi:hypothetical protein